jgi:hypothetical protein
VYDGANKKASEGLNLRNYWFQLPPKNAITRTERILIVGAATSERVLALAEHLAACEAAIDLCDDLDAALATIAHNPARWCALIVYVSPAEEIGDIAEDLGTFRVEASTVPVMVIGEQACNNNSYDELCDVADMTLFEPIRLLWFQRYLRLAENSCLERCLHLQGKTLGLTGEVGKL